MKVILEFEYNASEWTILWLFKTLRKTGIKLNIFKIYYQNNDETCEKLPEVFYSIAFIKKIVSLTTDMPENSFEISSRKQEVAENRQIAMYLCRKYTRKSLREIGYEFGNKTPATVMHACKVVHNLLQTDKKFEIKLSQIENSLISKFK